MLDTLLSLWETFGPLIMSCIKNEGREQTRKNLKRFGPLVEFRVRRQGRRSGLQGEQLDDFVNEARAAARAATDEELDDFLTMCAENRGPEVANPSVDAAPPA